MAKTHTAQKRRKDTPTTTRRHRYYFSNVAAKVGPHSFATKEVADTWAKTHDTKGLILYETPTGKLQWRPQPRE